MAARSSKAERLATLLCLFDVAIAVHREAAVAGDPMAERSLAFLRYARGLAESSATAAALRSLQRDLLIEWNEGVGPSVEEFWRRVAEAALPVAREHDVVAETLARGRIANMDHYIAFQDAFESLQICGKIDAEQAVALDRMLNAFQDDPKNRRYFKGSAAPPIEPTAIAMEVDLDGCQLVRVSDQYRLDYFDSSLASMLQSKGYQGGGETWAAITAALVDMLAPDVRSAIRIDPEADCLAVWAADPAPLQTVASLLARSVRDRRLLAKAIKQAVASGQME
jgi:hypothetical protein